MMDQDFEIRQAVIVQTRNRTIDEVFDECKSVFAEGKSPKLDLPGKWVTLSHDNGFDRSVIEGLMQSDGAEFRLETLSYISISELFAGHDDLLDVLACGAPFSWGDTTHTLITRADMLLWLGDEEEGDEIRRRLALIAEDVFIDLES